MDKNDGLLNRVCNPKVVPDKEAEDGDYLVCGPESYFPDDVPGVCSTCGAGVVCRPHAPRKPKRICVKCFLAMEQPDHVHVTESVFKEVSPLLKKLKTSL